jgi:RNase adaptor protein for sRNA GlmZ degradation
MSDIHKKIDQDYYTTKLPYPFHDKSTKSKSVLANYVKAYNEDQTRLNEEFYNDLMEHLELVGHPKANKVYNLAYQFGHSAGYSEVLYYAEELAELVK